MNRVKKIFLFLVPCSLSLILFSCQTIDLYEKTASIPGHKWKSSFKPSFSFTIKDTSSPYQLFLTVRHRDRYKYNNIYLNITSRQPGQDSTQTFMQPFELGNDENGWLGSGMDDIYEHRAPITPAGTPFYFRKPGEYTFTIEQVMREDPLEDIMNVGLRIEKK